MDTSVDQCADVTFDTNWKQQALPEIGLATTGRVLKEEKEWYVETECLNTQTVQWMPLSTMCRELKQAGTVCPPPSSKDPLFEEHMKDLDWKSSVIQHYTDIRKKDETETETQQSLKLFRAVNNQAKQAAIELTMEQIRPHVKKECRILDVACGSGGDVNKWKFSCKRCHLWMGYLGFDATKACVDEASRRFPNEEFITFDMTDKSWTRHVNHSPHVISCMLAAHYHPEVKRWFRECRSIFKDLGFVLLYVLDKTKAAALHLPSSSSICQIQWITDQRILFQLGERIKGSEESIYSIQEWTQFAQDAGFSVVWTKSAKQLTPDGCRLCTNDEQMLLDLHTSILLCTKPCSTITNHIRVLEPKDRFYGLVHDLPKSIRTKLQIHDIQTQYSSTGIKGVLAILNLVRNKFPTQRLEWIDTTAHIGMETIGVMMYDKQSTRFTCYEKQSDVHAALVHNLNLVVSTYRPDAIVNVFHSSSTNVDDWPKQQEPIRIVLCDPPWGGPAYKHAESVLLYLDDQPIDTWIKSFLSHSQMVILKAPRNFNRKSLSAVTSVVEHHPVAEYDVFFISKPTQTVFHVHSEKES